MPGTSRDRPGLLVLLVVLAFLLTSLAAVVVTSTVGSSATGVAQTGLQTTAISVGNSGAAACSDVDTCTTPAVTGLDAGDALVVVVTNHDGFDGDPTSVDEVTSGGNNALARIGGTDCEGMDHGTVAVYGLANVAAQTSVTFTVNYGDREYYTIHALDVHGTAPTPFETAGAAVCSGAAGTEASASVTTTLANDLVILGVEVRASETITATGGDTLVTSEEVTGENADSGAMLDETDSGTGSITLSATFTSADYAALAIALKPTLPLTAGTVSPATASVDAGQTLALSSTAASSGSGTYTYQWYAGSATCGSGSAINGATALDYTTPALSTGTDYYCVQDTDSETGETAYTNVAVVTVDTALSAHVTPSAPSIDPGQSVTLTVAASGGTGADTYQWFGDGGCTGSTLGTSTTLGTGSLSASQTFCVAVTDSAYAPVTVTATDTVTVSSSGLSAAVTPAAPAVDTGQSVNLTAEPSGGTGPYTYAWYAGSTCGVGSVLATTQLFTTPSLTADTSYCVTITDSSYEPVSASATVSVTVGSASLSVTILPVTPGIDSDQSILLTASPTGGTAPYTYVWREYDGSCTGASLGTSQTYTTPTLTSTTEYCVVVTDSSADPEQDTATDSVVVSAALSAVVAPAGPDIDLGQALELTADPSGGTGSDSFAWYLGVSCTGSVISTTASYQTPDLSATTSYCVAVTDSAHSPVTVTSSDTVTVSSATLSVAVDPDTPSIDPGQQVVLTADPSGGTSPDSYAWYAGLSCTGSVLGSSAAFTTPALDSSQSYCVLVTDSSYEPVDTSTTATVTVSSATLSVSISPTNPDLDPGQSVSLTATPAGGTAPDVLAWYQGSSCTGTVLATTDVFATPELTATTTYCVAVTDNSTEPTTVTATATVTVSSAVLSASITPQGPAIDLGQSVTLTAEPAGGTNPDGFAWFTGSTCGGTVLATTAEFVTPDLSATTTYCVSVTDNATDPTTVNATDTVTVSASALTAHVTPEGPSIDFGQSITLTATASGGTGTDAFAWYIGSSCAGSVVGTGASYPTRALSATTTFCVAATDSAFSPTTATATTTVTTSAVALSLSISPLTPSVKSGQTVTLTATPNGGTGSDSFAWYADSACTGAVVGTSASLTTPVLTAPASYCVAATDSSAVPVTATAAVQVSVTATTPPSSGTGSSSSPSIFTSDWWMFPLIAVVVLCLFLTVAWRRRKPAPGPSSSPNDPLGQGPDGAGPSSPMGAASDALPTALPPAAATTPMSVAWSPAAGVEAGQSTPVPRTPLTPADSTGLPASAGPSIGPTEEGPGTDSSPTPPEPEGAVPPTSEIPSPPLSVPEPTPLTDSGTSAGLSAEVAASEIPDAPTEAPGAVSVPTEVVAAAPVSDSEPPVLAASSPEVAPAVADSASIPVEEPAQAPDAGFTTPPQVWAPEPSPLPAAAPEEPSPGVSLSPTETGTPSVEPQATESVPELPAPEPAVSVATEASPAVPSVSDDVAPEVVIPAAPSDPVPSYVDPAPAPPPAEPTNAFIPDAEPPVTDTPVPESLAPTNLPLQAPEYESPRETPSATPEPTPVGSPELETLPTEPPTPAVVPEPPLSPSDLPTATFANWEVPVAPETPVAVPPPSDASRPENGVPVPAESAPSSDTGVETGPPIALGPGPQSEPTDSPSSPEPSGEPDERLPPARRAVLASWLFKNMDEDAGTKE